MTNRDQDSRHQSRPNDHLVEPMFAGLGVGDDEASVEEEEGVGRRRPGLIARLWRVLVGRSA
jgi:hypothetical protein